MPLEEVEGVPAFDGVVLKSLPFCAPEVEPDGVRASARPATLAKPISAIENFVTDIVMPLDVFARVDRYLRYPRSDVVR